MYLLLSELSKYFITILLALYTLECFISFRFKKQKNNLFYVRQWIYIFAIQFFAFYTMYVKQPKLIAEAIGDYLNIKTENLEVASYIVFFLFIQLVFVLMISISLLLLENCNRLLLNNMCMLLGIGFIIQTRMSAYRAIKQLTMVIISLILALIIIGILGKIKHLPDFIHFYSVFGIGILAIVLVMGNITHGSKLSFSIAGLTFQPSEFIKLLFVFFLASALYEKTNFTNILFTAVIAGMHVIILVLSKDLGSALIFFVAYICIVFMATDNFGYLLLGIAGFCIASVVAYRLFYHVRVRVLAWQDPFAYIDKEGFQITQSLFAIGSGNYFGLGLFGGLPKDIPYVETDFVFSAICEEMGVIAGICILLICISSFIMMMNIGLHLKDEFLRLLSAGFAVIYIFQIFLTIGGGIKMIPLTGVTLPFISYGGSSLLTSIVLFYLVEWIYSRYCEEGGAPLEKGKQKA